MPYVGGREEGNCGERRLTARLHSRLVPLDFGPLPFTVTLGHKVRRGEVLENRSLAKSKGTLQYC